MEIKNKVRIAILIGVILVIAAVLIETAVASKTTEKKNDKGPKLIPDISARKHMSDDVEKIISDSLN